MDVDIKLALIHHSTYNTTTFVKSSDRTAARFSREKVVDFRGTSTVTTGVGPSNFPSAV